MGVFWSAYCGTQISLYTIFSPRGLFICFSLRLLSHPSFNLAKIIFVYEPLDESERGEWKVGLKLNIHKTKIMASGPITSWQIDGEMVADFIFGAPKSLQMVTAAMKLKDVPWEKSYD